MRNDNLKEWAMKSFWVNLLETFDTGKAIVAALAVGVLGYLTNLLTSLYSFVYWNSYFECYNLPIQYFESAVDSISNFYGFVVAVPISVVYAILQIKYNNTINKMLERQTMQSTRSKFIAKWVLRNSIYVAMPCCYFCFCFLVLVILNGGNDFILSMFISSMVMNILLTLFCGMGNHNKAKANVHVKEQNERERMHNSWAAGIIISATVFLLSLFFVYLMGYYQKIILFDIPQVIAVDGDETTQEYGKLLETDSSYICVPISYEEGKEYIMNVQNGSYRVIPKDEIVTIMESDAFMMYRDKGTGILFDFIAYEEDAYWMLLAGSILFSMILLYVEYLFLVKKREYEGI